VSTSDLTSLADPDQTLTPVPLPPTVTGDELLPPLSKADSNVESALALLSARLNKMHAALPPLTALIIFTGHGDPQKMAQLSAKKAKFDKLWNTVKQSTIKNEDRWLAEDDRNLVDEVERCRAGLSFYCIK
jgi:RNA exonuclease 1